MRDTSGRTSRPTASSFGRMRVLLASMRGLNPGMSNTLKSDAVKPEKGMLGLLATCAESGSRVRRVGIQGEDGAPHPPERKAPEVRGGQPGGVDLDDLPRDG